ncbi:uncharacterized protein LOC128208756 [Mya arenaria]|uniref:uncharacterized protein LOC128208756 n=1 Tax=Mya arenaria TaxID=6604 RepID=UPI0022E8D90A|nr:uncharacterized protein LOC128208756 [Mya arenaria]
MNVVVLLAFIGYVAGDALLGQEECVWGPTYWCSHVSHARQCGAVQHCMGTVWKYQILPKPADADKEKTSVKACTYCELLVNEVKDVLHEKMTEAKIASLLSNVCTYLPNSDLIDLCKGIVTEYAPEIIEMINNDISTDMICTAVGFCPGLEDARTPNPEPTKLYTPEGTQAVGSRVAKNTTYCQDCMRFFHDVQESITSKETETQLEQLLNQTICSHLGPVASVCMDLLHQYLPMGLQILASQIDPDITCRVFGFCFSSGQHVPVIYIKNVFMGRGPMKSEECDICKDLVTEIDNAIKDSTTQAKVKEILENQVCPELGSLQDSCKQLVEEYLPMVFELLANELDPKTICEAISFCNTPQLAPVVEAALVEPAKMVGPGMVKDDLPCTVCKLVVQEIDTFLKQNKTEEEIKSLIDDVCKKLMTKDLQDQCSSFVDEYLELVLSLLAKELDPVAVCQEIKLCSKALLDVDIQAKPLKAGDGCDICIIVVQRLEQLLANASQEEILAELEKICAYVPAEYTTQCEKYMKEYAPLIISALKSKMDPRAACALAQMCKSGAPMMTIPIPEDSVKEKAGPSMECELCGTVLYYIKILLGNNASKEEIKTEIEKLCDQLPTELTSTCKSLVENYLDKVIDMLVKDIDINTICQEIGLCPALTSSSLGTDVVISPLMKPIDTLPLMLPSVGKETENNVQVKEKAGPSMECELCGTVLYYIKVLLGNNASKEEIKTEIEKLCTQLPTELTSECKSLVENYLDKVIDMLVKDIDINTICQEIGLCPALTSSSLGTDVVISPLMKPMDTLPLMLPSVGKETENNVQANAIECEACQEVMKYLDSQLQENKTEEHIKEVLKEVCSRMPSAISGECSKLVDQYTQLIIDYILLSESPDAICKSLRLCAQASVASMKQLPKPVHVKLVKDPQERPLKAGPECMLCEFVLKEIDNLLKGNMSEAAIKSALAKVCSLMPETIAEECDTFVNQYAAQIIDLLIHEIDPKTICTSIGLCATKEVVLKERPVKGGPECVLCEFVLKEIDNLLKGNKSEAAIKSALAKVCSLLPDTIAQECNNFVNQYAAQIIQLLIQEIDPKQICASIGLCATKEVVVKDVVAAGPICVLCEFVMRELDGMLKGNRSVVAIEEALDKVCSLMPDTLSAECTDFVKQYGKLVIQFLVQELDPKEICTKLTLCSGDLIGNFAAKVQIIKDAPKVKNEDLCEVCKLVVGEIKQYIKENHTDAEVEKYLKQLCNILPNTVTAQCHDIVSQYVPAILRLLEENLNETQVCQGITLCPKVQTETLSKASHTLFFHPSKPLLGAKNCTWGPSYWCASKENAHKCGAVEHCMKHVWN